MQRGDTNSVTLFARTDNTKQKDERNSLSGEFRPARKAERLIDCLEDRLGEIAMAVKMRPSHTRTKRPRGALLELDPVLNN